MLLDAWHNTDTQKTLYEKVEKNCLEIERRAAVDEEFKKIHISQLVLTGQFSPGRIFQYIFSVKTPRIHLLTQQLHKHKEMMYFMRSNIENLRFNYCILDFVDYEPALVNY